MTRYIMYEPVAEPVKCNTCCQCNWSNGDLLNMAQEPGFAPEWWCHGCLSRLVNAHRDETGKFIKLKDAKTEPVKTPVVQWWRWRNLCATPLWCKTVYGLIVEWVKEDGRVANSPQGQLIPVLWFEILESEYEAAKSPPTPADPLADRIAALEKRIEILEKK